MPHLIAASAHVLWHGRPLYGSMSSVGRQQSAHGRGSSRIGSRRQSSRGAPPLQTAEDGQDVGLAVEQGANELLVLAGAADDELAVRTAREDELGAARGGEQLEERRGHAGHSPQSRAARPATRQAVVQR